ncbi:unnamed protein product [Tilletia caries]|nr:unnamed protein product [Tilletia caries]
MLYNLEPSSELSGGAWYSDTELDEAFIEAISNACLRSIQERVLAVLITRSHRYHDHAETDGTQDIASQFAAAYDKEPEPYSHSSARRKARSRDLRTWTQAMHGRGIPSLHPKCIPTMTTEPRHRLGCTAIRIPIHQTVDDQIFRVRFDLTASGFLFA